ncbi:hypothetical protein EVAR_42524_1 [Eumeta japonica]|uniref:Uncharacterized protein n=1 Tax=Eumeta variegata TaxID=151549 RepID=A0A4C1XJ28_EUMVA|nr:hypothetical protein EVAR_42524_1 [Eumeta japonica]
MSNFESVTARTPPAQPHFRRRKPIAHKRSVVSALTVRVRADASFGRRRRRRSRSGNHRTDRIVSIMRSIYRTIHRSWLMALARKHCALIVR